VAKIGGLGTTLAMTNNRNVLRNLLVTANVPSKPILVTLMMEAPRSVLRLLVSANVVPSSPILSTLMMEAIRSSETTAFFNR
jgi:hypothetical protein